MRAAERKAIEKEARREERKKNWEEFTKMVDDVASARRAEMAAREAEEQEQKSLRDGDDSDEAGAGGGV
jgi:hypothetical protein